MYQMNSLKSLFATVSLIFFSQLAFSQLTDFSLIVTKTNETCTGNGSLTFSVSGTTENATMVYMVYLLPNTTTPIATQSETTLGGLAAGTYRVVATQTLGNLSNTQQQDATISNVIVDLAYQVSGSITCNDGIITVNVTQGTAVGYEIISGPVIRPQQTSNVFNLLSPGVYVLRVYDACGDAVVQTYTLVANANINLSLTGVGIPDCPLIDCNTIGVKTTLTSGFGISINYPVTVVFTVFPPTGIPVVLTQTVAGGNPSSQSFTAGIPFFNDQDYICNVVVTDNCGNTVSSNNNVIHEKFNISAISDNAICVKNIKIDGCNYVMPVTVTFLSAPTGFNPTAINPSHPGPFAEFPINYISTDANTMPNGDYNIRVTDACGRTAESLITLDGETLEPFYIVLPGSCGVGQISMPQPNGTLVASVIMNTAPSTFEHALPYDVSFNIAGGHFVMGDLPSGTYTFTVVSVCDVTYNYTIVVPPSQQMPIQVSYITGCDEGFGSIRLSIQNTGLAAVIINSAPVAFEHALPYDVSFNITEDGFYMNSFPEGVYTFSLQDDCGGTPRIITLTIPGYHILQNNVVVDENCGSFNVFLEYASNENAAHVFALQKLNPQNNQWMHPITNVAYIDGDNLTPMNSIMLNNMTTTLSIASVGTFRVVKQHKIYGNGASSLENCVRSIKDFVINGGPRITMAYNLPCTTNPGQVLINAEGLAPLSYFITTKDGETFEVDNGTSNVFSGLAPGIYNFQVRDVCGNIVNRLFDYNSVPTPTIAQSVLCDNQNGQLSVANLTFLSYQWWKGTNTTTILSTTNELNFTPFNSAMHSGTYYVRIYSTQQGLCTDQIVSYTIPESGNNPNAGDGTTSDICGSSGTVDLFTLLTGNYATGGNWLETTNSGMQIGHSWLPVGIPYGTYVFKYTVNGLCATSDEATVTIHFNPIPASPDASVAPFICAAENIQLFATTISNASYVWTGPNGFTSTEQNPFLNNITAEASGIYSVKAKIGNCESPASIVNVNVNAIPQFALTAGCNGNVFEMKAIPSGIEPSIISYEWSGPENFTSTSNPIDITGGKKGTYTVTATSENGCTFTSSIEVLGTLCAIPKGLSPNDDGSNDSYDLTGYDVLKFKIYNRYGRMVFEQDDYTNQWHGQDFNDNILPDATYYYYIKMKTGEEKTGWVYVSK